MVTPRKMTGIIASILVLIISVLVFYLSYIDITSKTVAFGVIGLLAILFATISYLMHAFIGQKKVVSSFAWGYYAFGVLSMLIATVVIKLNILYLILVLVFVLVSFAFIYWRLSTMISDPS